MIPFFRLMYCKYSRLLISFLLILTLFATFAIYNGIGTSRNVSYANKVYSLTNSKLVLQATDFALPGVDGRIQTLSSQQGHEVVLMFFCGCRRCYTAAKRVSSLQQFGKLSAVTAVASMPLSLTRRFQKETGLLGYVLSDASNSIAVKYESELCPRFWVISPTGSIRYRSDSALEGKDLEIALSELQRIHVAN